jgi:hypothetical protein
MSAKRRHAIYAGRSACKKTFPKFPKTRKNDDLRAKIKPSIYARNYRK